ncbi:MAG TPA: helix-turn-helix transcriptional regulator [Pelobium sp.]|nr:helix-turn-helix transcriptional regulator [Pelobium sp.]
MQEIASKRKLGTRLKSLRIKEELSQEELAKILGISRSNYSQIELGKQYPTYQSLYLLCKYFDKDYSWILNSEDNDVEPLPKVSLKQTNNSTKQGLFPFIDLVSSKYEKKYLTKFGDKTFIGSLPQISFPVTDPKIELRAFEISKNHPNLNLVKGDIVVCSKVEILQSIDMRFIYLILSTKKLLVSKCAFNLANESILIIDKHKHEQLNTSEIKEIWKVQSKFSSNFGVEEQKLELQTEKFENMLNELRTEINRFRTSVLQKYPED